MKQYESTSKDLEMRRGASLSGFNRLFRVVYMILAWGLVVCIAYQVFLAGMAVFVDATNWASHTGFVHLFEFVPILLLGLAFAGRMPRGHGLYLLPIALWMLIGAQYAFAEAGRSVVAAIHPVNALIIFWCSVLLARRTGSAAVATAETVVREA